jgi:hypothetical protein
MAHDLVDRSADARDVFERKRLKSIAAEQYVAAFDRWVKAEGVSLRRWSSRGTPGCVGHR